MGLPCFPMVFGASTAHEEELEGFCFEDGRWAWVHMWAGHSPTAWELIRSRILLRKRIFNDFWRKTKDFHGILLFFHMFFIGFS